MPLNAKEQVSSLISSGFTQIGTSSFYQKYPYLVRVTEQGSTFYVTYFGLYLTKASDFSRVVLIDNKVKDSPDEMVVIGFIDKTGQLSGYSRVNAGSYNGIYHNSDQNLEPQAINAGYTPVEPAFGIYSRTFTDQLGEYEILITFEFGRVTGIYKLLEYNSALKPHSTVASYTNLPQIKDYCETDDQLIIQTDADYYLLNLLGLITRINVA